MTLADVFVPLPIDDEVENTLLYVPEVTDQILEEANTWGADCIFVGAKGTTGIDRLLLGSVSSAVSVRAHCSVEVVRPSNRTA